MPTKRFPRLPEPPNQAPMWQDEENDPYQGIVSHRGYDMHTMREFPAPFDTDPGLSGEGDDLPGLQEPGEMFGMPLIDEAKMQQRDPRIDAIEQMARQGQVQRPGMKTEQDLEAFGKQYGMPSEQERLAAPQRRTLGDMMGMPFGGQGTPDELAEADATAKMSDEDLLSQVQKQMNRPMDAQGNDPIPPPVQDPPDMWPSTPEEFKQKYGRAPATDDEIAHYYGDVEDDYPTDEPTNEDDMRRGRY